jgi:hypothetical protein
MLAMTFANEESRSRDDDVIVYSIDSFVFGFTIGNWNLESMYKLKQKVSLDWLVAVGCRWFTMVLYILLLLPFSTVEVDAEVEMRLKMRMSLR